MLIGHFIAAFFIGVFGCNCIPHLISGLRGDLFPTPFATPGGVGNSSSLVNFFWGTVNLAVAITLLAFFPMRMASVTEWLVFFLGFILMGTRLSLHFGKVRRG